jgi:imidazolonepropionase
LNGGALVAPRVITPSGPAPRRGEALTELLIVSDGALAWDEAGIVSYIGPAAGLSSGANPRRVTGAIVPGFVDAHTHLPFFGWRADEFRERLAGRTYRDVHGEGGGIARSARLLGAASDEDVLAFSAALAVEMAAHGTTALELKTGYGLSVEAEVRQARLARRLGASIPQATTVTLLACHAVPADTTRERWVERACRELIPAVAAEGLADAVDVYVEDIAFTVDDLRRVADAAREAGMAVRCHADQLGASGAAEAAVGVGARNADHLNHLSRDGLTALARGETAAVLLPVADWFTREKLPPVAELERGGAALVLATDLNPGTSPCLSIPEVMAAAGSLYRLSPAAALAASTLNPAWALALDDRLGSLEVGKRADIVAFDLNKAHATVGNRPIAALVFSAHGTDVDTVIVNGKVLLRGGRLVGFDREEEILEEARRRAHEAICHAHLDERVFVHWRRHS